MESKKMKLETTAASQDSDSSHGEVVKNDRI